MGWIFLWKLLYDGMKNDSFKKSSISTIKILRGKPYRMVELSCSLKDSLWVGQHFRKEAAIPANPSRKHLQSLSSCIAGAWKFKWRTTVTTVISTFAKDYHFPLVIPFQCYSWALFPWPTYTCIWMKINLPGIHQAPQDTPWAQSPAGNWARPH